MRWRPVECEADTVLERLLYSSVVRRIVSLQHKHRQQFASRPASVRANYSCFHLRLRQQVRVWVGAGITPPGSCYTAERFIAQRGNVSSCHRCRRLHLWVRSRGRRGRRGRRGGDTLQPEPFIKNQLPKIRSGSLRGGNCFYEATADVGLKTLTVWVNDLGLLNTDEVLIKAHY